MLNDNTSINPFRQYGLLPHPPAHCERVLDDYIYSFPPEGQIEKQLTSVAYSVDELQLTR